MYLRTTQRRNKDGSVVRYLALAENRRHPEKGHVEARVIHSFGREDQLDRAALERLVASIRRVLGDTNGGPDAHDAASAGSAPATRAVEPEVAPAPELPSAPVPVTWPEFAVCGHMAGAAVRGCG